MLYYHFPSLSVPPGQAIDSPLSETGLQQAEAAGLYLKDIVFSNVFVSDMLRARQVRCFRTKWFHAHLNKSIFNAHLRWMG